MILEILATLDSLKFLTVKKKKVSFPLRKGRGWVGGVGMGEKEVLEWVKPSSSQAIILLS